jgi:hypothetical protein
MRVDICSDLLDRKMTDYSNRGISNDSGESREVGGHIVHSYTRHQRLTFDCPARIGVERGGLRPWSH